MNRGPTAVRIGLGPDAPWPGRARTPNGAGIGLVRRSPSLPTSRQGVLPLSARSGVAVPIGPHEPRIPRGRHHSGESAGPGRQVERRRDAISDEHSRDGSGPRAAGGALARRGESVRRPTGKRGLPQEPRADRSVPRCPTFQPRASDPNLKGTLKLTGPSRSRVPQLPSVRTEASAPLRRLSGAVRRDGDRWRPVIGKGIRSGGEGLLPFRQGRGFRDKGRRAAP